MGKLVSCKSDRYQLKLRPLLMVVVGLSCVCCVCGPSLKGVEPATCMSSAEVHVRAAALVFLNGNILGLHRRPRKFVRAMRWVGGWS